VVASGCKWLQVVASGCKWLQVHCLKNMRIDVLLQKYAQLKGDVLRGEKRFAKKLDMAYNLLVAEFATWIGK
jgi:hypothetical protein